MLTPYKNREHGFTLVELICVVVIIGILGSLAIPGWNGIMRMIILSDCELQISSYNRAVIGFYTNHGRLPLTIGEVENDGLVSVLACPKDSPSDCQSLAPVNASTRLIGGGGNFNTYWPSPSGHCAIQFRGGYGMFSQFWASPHHNSPHRNWSASACFNAQTGASKVRRYKIEISQYHKAGNTFC